MLPRTKILFRDFYNIGYGCFVQRTVSVFGMFFLFKKNAEVYFLSARILLKLVDILKVRVGRKAIIIEATRLSFQTSERQTFKILSPPKVSETSESAFLVCCYK
jgi:hypothetical protein